MDAQEVRHVALGAAIDIWGDGDVDLHGLLHMASTLEGYLLNGYDPQKVKAPPAQPTAPATVVVVDPPADPTKA